MSGFSFLSLLSYEFLLTSLIVVLLPGTGVLYTLAVGLGRGFWPSVAAALGCTFGIVPAAVASIVGLAAIFHTSALAFVVVKYLGVAYLLYMAWSILGDKSLLTIQETNDGKDSKQRSYFTLAIHGTLLNVFNPKLSLFFLAFLPQFIPANTQSSVASLVYLAVVFMLMTFAVFVVYGAFASAARKYIIESPTALVWLKRGFATAFAALGLRLALAELLGLKY